VIGLTEQLWIESGDGAAKAHRVIPWGQPRLAVIEDRRCRAIPVRFVGSANERLVPATDLVPATPLTEAEEREYQKLDAVLAGTMGEARTLKRFNGLRLRSLIFGASE